MSQEIGFVPLTCCRGPTQTQSSLYRNGESSKTPIARKEIPSELEKAIFCEIQLAFISILSWANQYQATLV